MELSYLKINKEFDWLFGANHEAPTNQLNFLNKLKHRNMKTQTSNFFKTNEKILFQIKEGTCSRNCPYCYEKGKLKSEMPFVVLEHGFKMLNSLNIREAELIGSEPTEYSRWNDLIKLAKDQNVDLTVYTSGLHLEKLNNDKIKKLILHVMFKPDEKFMQSINNLLDKGKFIYLRINFDAKNLGEKDIVSSFLVQLPEKYHKQVSLKYSFTSKVENSSIEFTDIETLKEIKPKFLKFCQEIHNKFPKITMYAERPIFKCCFTLKEQEEYSYAGLASICNMEYTVYKDGQIALCPTVENLVPKRTMNTPQQLINAIKKIRKNMAKLIKKPSFKDCEKCKFLQDASCQGGCFSYKL